MKEAVEFADLIENANPRTSRTRLRDLSAKITGVNDTYFIGNPRSKRQTTDTSVQSTFALDLAQIASFVKSTMGGAQSFYKVKHDADEPDRGFRRAEAEIRNAVTDATAILKEFANTPDLPNLRGLLVLICQYLRLGRHAYVNNKWILDKNLTALLSRINLSIGRKGLPDVEKNWVAANRVALRQKILAKTRRKGNSTVCTDPAQREVDTTCNVSAEQFIVNVLTKDDDGVTDTLKAFKKLGLEEIHPPIMNTVEEINNTKKAPVFELRNMIPALGENERIPRSEWVKVARFLSYVVGTLHERSDQEAMKDAEVMTKGPLDQAAASYVGVEEEDESWKS